MYGVRSAVVGRGIMMAFVMRIDAFGREAGVCRAVLFILSDAEMVAFCTL